LTRRLQRLLPRGRGNEWAALFDRLSHNFSSTPTWLAPVEKSAGGPARWQPLPVRPPPRTEAVRVFDLFEYLPLDDVLARFEDLARRRPDSPFAFTHRAELLLWLGRYGEAEADCRRALSISEWTRWAWVGLGGALLLQMRPVEAIEVMDRADRMMTAGPPLLAFRGEAHWRAGHPGPARRDLQATVEGTPSRASSWIILALIDADDGRPSACSRVHARLCRRLPALAASARRDLGWPSRVVESSDDEKQRMLRHVLAMMRGNRSSHRITWLPRDGLLRVVGAESLGEGAQTIPGPDHASGEGASGGDVVL